MSILRLGHDDRGSTLPLILGFFLVALLAVAGSVAAGDAFVHQRSLQDVCDGAAAAAAASAADLARGSALAGGAELRFAGAQAAVAAYLARDGDRAHVQAVTGLSQDATVLTVRCEQTSGIVFGAMFGLGRGVHQSARSSARAPLS
ncbi:hypothetical protein M6B22_07410 [Jatrophihabitans cynanchi]|uniref:Flp pilus-assembly TadG-like N-terminal domain-containing protein n=1 Tax=Jatrophihabitans cynanchi TaxID=2944128 RepID=A0ABY7K159_9ACTN|nr:pilus assembly protein TadG-related protein [Jatrophihabitans sp. SB3-54]WAX58583.1 hypothetical protein M6B22_07410 [Jatrophihabitans sp. SB3-54]